MKYIKGVLLPFLLCAILIFAGCNIVSNVAAISGGREYFPNTDGHSWTYTLEGRTLTYKWNGTQTFAGLTLQKYFLYSSGGTSEGLYLVTDSAVTYYGSSFAPTTDAQTVLSFPLTVGKKWGTSNSRSISTSGVISSEPVTVPGRPISTSEVIGSETVTVPAGTFNCIKIKTNTTFTIMGEVLSTEAYAWFAPNVGPVKSTMSGTSMMSTMELVSKNF